MRSRSASTAAFVLDNAALTGSLRRPASGGPVESKTCPTCGTEVPVVANRCKSCFHDFRAAPKKASALWPALIALGIMGAAGGGTMYWLAQQPTDQRIHVDGPNQVVQWITQFQDGRLETDQISFDQIAKLEYTVTRMGEHEIAAITVDGRRKILASDPDRALELQAQSYADLIKKPLEVKDETSSVMD